LTDGGGGDPHLEGREDVTVVRAPSQLVKRIPFERGGETEKKGARLKEKAPDSVFRRKEFLHEGGEVEWKKKNPKKKQRGEGTSAGGTLEPIGETPRCEDKTRGGKSAAQSGSYRGEKGPRKDTKGIAVSSLEGGENLLEGGGGTALRGNMRRKKAEKGNLVKKEGEKGPSVSWEGTGVTV